MSLSKKIKKKQKKTVNNEENLDPDADKSVQQIKDEMTGQLNLFDKLSNKD